MTFSAIYALAWREVIRFLRQRSRVIGALATPVIFWLFIGLGVGRTFQSASLGASGENFLAYFFPGTVVMILLFTAIFSTISVIEDRREGFLQGVLVAPVGRGSIVLGKIFGGAVLAFVQGCLFLAAGPFVGVDWNVTGWLAALGIMAVLSVGLTGLGLCLAWSMSSTQGFHAVMNLLLMPMWFLSGSLFPAEGAWGPIRWVMAVNPLSWGLAGVRRGLHFDDAALAASSPPLWACFAVCLLFAGATICLSWIAATRPVRAGIE